MLFTLGSIYLTVLPLYQKALLDEAIARKEVELKVATASLEKKYVKIRFLAVREYVASSGPECTGLLIRSTDSPGATDYANKVLGIDIGSCLLAREAKFAPLDELRPEDRTFFRAALQNRVDELIEMRRIAIRAVDDAAVDVDKIGIDAIIAKTEFDRRLIPILKTLYGPQQIAKTKRSMAIKDLRLSRSMEYANRARDKLITLYKVSWPEQKQ